MLVLLLQLLQLLPPQPKLLPQLPKLLLPQLQLKNKLNQNQNLTNKNQNKMLIKMLQLTLNKKHMKNQPHLMKTQIFAIITATLIKLEFTA